jgi:hypothetical protein
MLEAGKHLKPSWRQWDRLPVVHSSCMHTYKLLRQGALVQVFVDDQPSARTLSANQRNELRDYLESFGLRQADIDFKVHELYLTNSTSFTVS